MNKVFHNTRPISTKKLLVTPQLRFLRKKMVYFWFVLVYLLYVHLTIFNVKLNEILGKFCCYFHDVLYFLHIDNPLEIAYSKNITHYMCLFHYIQSIKLWLDRLIERYYIGGYTDIQIDTLIYR